MWRRRCGGNGERKGVRWDFVSGLGGMSKIFRLRFGIIVVFCGEKRLLGNSESDFGEHDAVSVWEINCIFAAGKYMVGA